LHLNANHAFKGIYYAKGFMEECSSTPGSQILSLPLTSCGIRSKMLSRDSMQYSVQIIAQHSSKLQQKSDFEIFVKCEMSTEMMDHNIERNEMKSQRNGRMRFLKTSTKIRSWLEIDAQRIDYAIVGENITFSVVSILPRNIGIKIVDCLAFDGVGDSSQKLFDEFGCPIDEFIMPNFIEKVINFDDGWSKMNDDDTVKKVATSSNDDLII
jgi:hypothetical protein